MFPFTSSEDPALRLTWLALDVTDPSRVLEIKGRTRRAGAEYVFKGAVPGRGTRQLLAFSKGAVRAPERLERNNPSYWSRERAGADMVLLPASPAARADFPPFADPAPTRRHRAPACPPNRKLDEP